MFLIDIDYEALYSHGMKLKFTVFFGTVVFFLSMGIETAQAQVRVYEVIHEGSVVPNTSGVTFDRPFTGYVNGRNEIIFIGGRRFNFLYNPLMDH